MFIAEEQKGSFGSFKLGYSRGLPSYMAPKLLVHKKQEEYFIASILAQSLIYTQIPVIGVNVTSDDSNKGADAIIKLLDGKEMTLQVTRFTLTDYLNRRKVAEKKVHQIIGWIKEKTSLDFPVNITVSTLKYNIIPANSRRIEMKLAHYIASLIEANKEKLKQSNDFVNCEVTIDKLKTFIPLITLQSIPKDFYSNFFGRDNIFINYEFDNIGFTEKDIDDEAVNIYNKKNNGKASTLIIWADTWEILYDPTKIVESLKKQFVDSSFEQVIFFDFYNRIDMYQQGKIRIAEIKVGNEFPFY